MKATWQSNHPASPREELIESLFPGPAEKVPRSVRNSLVLREAGKGMLGLREGRMTWTGHWLCLGSRERGHGPSEPSQGDLHYMERVNSQHGVRPWMSVFYLLSKVRGMSLYWKFLRMWLAAQQGLTGHEGREGEKEVGQPSLRAVPPALGSE